MSKEIREIFEHIEKAKDSLNSESNTFYRFNTRLIVKLSSGVLEEVGPDYQQTYIKKFYLPEIVGICVKYDEYREEKKEMEKGRETFKSICALYDIPLEEKFEGPSGRYAEMILKGEKMIPFEHSERDLKILKEISGTDLVKYFCFYYRKLALKPFSTGIANLCKSEEYEKLKKVFSYF